MPATLILPSTCRDARSDGVGTCLAPLTPLSWSSACKQVGGDDWRQKLRKVCGREFSRIERKALVRFFRFSHNGPSECKRGFAALDAMTQEIREWRPHILPSNLRGWCLLLVDEAKKLRGGWQDIKDRPDVSVDPQRPQPPPQLEPPPQQPLPPQPQSTQPPKPQLTQPLQPQPPQLPQPQQQPEPPQPQELEEGKASPAQPQEAGERPSALQPAQEPPTPPADKAPAAEEKMEEGEAPAVGSQ